MDQTLQQTETLEDTAEQLYLFERDQLYELLKQTIGMFLEYRDHHDQAEPIASISAIQEMFCGLDTERELVESDPNFIPTSQILLSVVDDTDGLADDLNDSIEMETECTNEINIPF
jgi:hypothetical protein